MSPARVARVQRYVQALNERTIERTYPIDGLPDGSVLWETALLDGSYAWTVECPDGSLSEVVR